MNIEFHARTYASAAENRAAHKDIRRRLFNPTNGRQPIKQEAPKPLPPVHDPETFRTLRIPRWTWDDIHFDAHIWAYHVHKTGGGHPIRSYIRRRAEELGFTVEDITGESRQRNLVRARQLLIWEVKMVLRPNASLFEVGKAFGGRDHTTVIHALRKIQDMKDRGEID